MTKDEIKDGNKLVASFMNVKETRGHYNSYGMLVPTYQIVHNLYNGRSYSKPALSYKAFLNRAEYSFNWNWLIPVINKIKFLEEYPAYVDETYSRWSEEGVYINTHSIGETFKSVIKFIEWYNKQK